MLHIYINASGITGGLFGRHLFTLVSFDAKEAGGWPGVPGKPLVTHQKRLEFITAGWNG